MNSKIKDISRKGKDITQIFILEIPISTSGIAEERAAEGLVPPEQEEHKLGSTERRGKKTGSEP